MLSTLNCGALSLAVLSLLASPAAGEVFDKLRGVPDGKSRQSFFQVITDFIFQAGGTPTPRIAAIPFDCKSPSNNTMPTASNRPSWICLPPATPTTDSTSSLMTR